MYDDEIWNLQNQVKSQTPDPDLCESGPRLMGILKLGPTTWAKAMDVAAIEILRLRAELASRQASSSAEEPGRHEQE